MVNDDDSIVDGDCRTFDVKDTGRISESKFRQILATKQVPKEDVDGILEGETVAHRVKYQPVPILRVQKAGGGSERHEQRGRFWGANSLQRWTFQWRNYLEAMSCCCEKSKPNVFVAELIQMLQAPPAEG